MRYLLVLLLVWLPSAAAAGPFFPKTYDVQLRQASELYLPGLPWQLLKAQLYQESRLDPTAKSGVGAEGVGQFMPNTWSDISKALGYVNVPRSEAGPAIAGAAYYMRQLRAAWNTTDFDRHKLALGAYNAGGGNLRRSVRLCGGSLVWDIASQCIVQVTGEANARQTTGYITSIWRWFGMLQTGA